MAHRDITLTYDPNGAVHSHPDPITVEIGDTVTFHCDQGPLNVLFLPEGAFSMNEFHTGDGPVKRLLAGPTKICCGVVIAGITFGYPEHRRFGHQLIPDSTDDSGGAVE